MGVEIIVPLVIALVMGVFALLTAYRQNLTRMIEKKENRILRERLTKYLDDNYNWLASQYINESETENTRYFRELRNFFMHSLTYETKPDIVTQVIAKVDELKERLETIEARFPQEATLEKIASVNDAILATQLETLSDSMKLMQDKMLTKWDVVKILFAILSALGVLVGLIFGIINLI